MVKHVTKRFLDCLSEIQNNGQIKSDRQFAISLDYKPQSFSKIRKGERSVTMDLVRKSAMIYKFNPVYILLGVGDKFMKQDDSHLVKIAVDDKDNEKILHIPMTAKAGYMDQFNDEQYLENLTAYSLPWSYFQHGTFRSFEIEGDSMEPILQHGEIVICSNVDDPSLWSYNIRSGYVYVIVTQNDIVIKRVINRLPQEGVLELVSDNSQYPPIIVKAEELKEVWYVKMKISSFGHSKLNIREELMTKYSALNETIKTQSKTIERLNKTIEKLLQKQRII
jgi:phage repressor protein C with HTH and peptisase S24 domain